MPLNLSDLEKMEVVDVILVSLLNINLLVELIEHLGPFALNNHPVETSIVKWLSDAIPIHLKVLSLQSPLFGL